MLTLSDSLSVPLPVRRFAPPTVAWFDSRRIDLASVHDRASAMSHDAGPAMSVGAAAATVIWSRIMAAVLPHGAVPAYALVLTGDDASRAKLLRQSALCPSDYLEGAASAANIADDFQRVFGDDVPRTGGVETIGSGLHLMACRHAEQLAACFSKRIFPGVQGPSALALDGRVAACAGASHIPGYRRATGVAQEPDQWRMQETVLAVVRALRRRIGACLPQDEARLMPEEELVQAFRQALGRARERALLRMTGLPAGFIRTEPAAARSRLYRCMREIYRRGGDLNAILVHAAAVPAPDLDGALRPHLDDDGLRREFIEAYVDSRARFIGAHPAGLRMHAHLYLALQACRLNADLSFLVRGDPDVTDEDPSGLGERIDALVARGRYLLADPHPDLKGQHAQAQVDSLDRLGPGSTAFVMACMDKVGVAPDIRVRMLRLAGPA